MCAPTYQKGEPAVVSEPPNPAGRHGRREPSYHHVVVTKVGSVWITVKSAGGMTWRFDKNLEPADEHDIDTQLWKSIQAAQAHHHRERAFDDLKRVFRDLTDPPAHLSGADLDAIILTLKGDRP